MPAADLIEQVWGDYPVNESSMSSLQVHISTLRKKLMQDDFSLFSIKTIY